VGFVVDAEFVELGFSQTSNFGNPSAHMVTQSVDPETQVKGLHFRGGHRKDLSF
jgi:hypothetical protein